MTTQIQTAPSDLLFAEAKPLFGEVPAQLRKAWERLGARFMVAAASLCLALIVTSGIVTGITSAGALI